MLTWRKKLAMALTPSQARGVYDRIGRLQDWQAFYEDATTDRLVTHAALGAAQAIFELGCGTGRLAERLLQELPGSVSYVGVDLSPKMIALATGHRRWPHSRRALGSVAGPGRCRARRWVAAPPGARGVRRPGAVQLRVRFAR